jgi:hypothetical protein
MTSTTGREPASSGRRSRLDSAARRLSPAERAERGKAARLAVPRDSQAVYDPPVDRADPVSLLERQAATRLPDLVPVRYGRMLGSPFSYFRGAALAMAADLAAAPVSGLAVQACGDAHLSNFGVYASPERALVFDLNDFDETLPGPWEWDVKRLAASLEVAGRQNRYRSGQRRKIVTAAVCRYREAMRGFAARPTWRSGTRGQTSPSCASSSGPSSAAGPGRKRTRSRRRRGPGTACRRWAS